MRNRNNLDFESWTVFKSKTLQQQISQIWTWTAFWGSSVLRSQVEEVVVQLYVGLSVNRLSHQKGQLVSVLAWSRHTDQTLKQKKEQNQQLKACETPNVHIIKIKSICLVSRSGLILRSNGGKVFDASAMFVLKVNLIKTENIKS